MRWIPAPFPTAWRAICTHVHILFNCLFVPRLNVPCPCVQWWQAESGKKTEPLPQDTAALPSGANSGGGKPSTSGTEDIFEAEDSSKGEGGGGGVREIRSLKGAAPDEDNSSAASMLRARLGS